MLVRRVRIQLIAFAVIAVVGIVYALIRFAGLGTVFGGGGYTVKLELAQTGGIFTGAEVTYRGFNIGKVGPLSLTETGLQAELDIDQGAPAVPTDLLAVVANRSAVGEQFVDLRPNRADGPTLTDGAVIPQSRSRTPVPTEKLIGDLDTLATSVPTDALRTVVDESYKAFSGTGPDLQVLLDTTRDFTAAAQANLPQTIQLLDAGGTVLKTQNDEADALKSFSGDLKALSGQLRSSDGDLRRLIGVTPQVAQQISGVLKETGPGLSALTANLLTTANIAVTRLDGAELALIIYPAFAAASKSVAPGDGYAHLGLALNMFNPPSCTKGYPRAQSNGTAAPAGYRTGAQTSPRPADDSSYCAEPKGSPISVRGAQNAPYNGVPTPPTQGQIDANSGRSAEAMQERSNGTPGVVSSPGLSLTTLPQLLGLPG